jgi:hypothetical protein
MRIPLPFEKEAPREDERPRIEVPMPPAGYFEYLEWEKKKKQENEKKEERGVAILQM